MIIITVAETDKDVMLSMSGHAEFNPGNDIVCSAASMLGQTLAQVVMDMEAEGMLSSMSMEPIVPGKITISATAAGSWKRELITAFDTVLTGFKLLCARYPDYVQLTLGDMKKG